MTVKPALGYVDRTSVHPTCRTVGDGGSLCLLLTAQYWVKAAGRPLILQGSYPAGAPGGAWPKVRIGAPQIETEAGTQALHAVRDFASDTPANI